MSFLHLFRRGMATTAIPQTVKTGLLLSRIPIVTQELTTLEKQYYEYQSELERRLMWTFPQYFYFKRGTLAERRFLAAQKGPISKQPGVWFPKGVPDIKHNRERSQKQDVRLAKESVSSSSSDAMDAEDVSRPIVVNSRITEADRTGDLNSLERKLSRTLYLLVKHTKGDWMFPAFPVSLEQGSKKPLHITAEEGLRALGGQNINTWTVSNTPAGVLQNGDTAEFLIKSHIVAGKFELQKGSEYDGYAWLTKDEIKDHLDEAHYKEVDFLLSDV
ncbi:LAFE_0G02850g1_1 [Lachancea fermentati]|uniref:Large ribosomal subunit protein mL46 n=1 Tax=Lachancea fermentati TaxID=4955 RepID=A0A1G4MGU4_LACFM|nr:LAFE_0G02850g1_1 [Lachancea fermentati]